MHADDPSAARCPACKAWNDSHIFPVECYRCGATVAIPTPAEVWPTRRDRPEGNQWILLTSWGKAYYKDWAAWRYGQSPERPRLDSYKPKRPVPGTHGWTTSSSPTQLRSSSWKQS